jgi:alanyl-tRNA synthetase
MTLKNPQDVGKAVIALQEDNAKHRKQLEAMLKDKAKNMKTELAQEIQEVNGIQFSKQVDLNPEGAKRLGIRIVNLRDKCL